MKAAREREREREKQIKVTYVHDISHAGKKGK